MIIKIINETINNTLNFDPQKNHILNLTQYKTLKINIIDWKLSFIILPRDDKIEIVDAVHSEIRPDCTIEGKLFDLISLIKQKDGQTLIQQNIIKQSGDLHILQSYQKSIKAFEVDLSGKFQHLFGPSIANIITTPLLQAKKYLSNSLSSTKTDLSEYIQEEKKQLPPQEEVSDFFEDIGEVNLMLDRVEAKLIKFIAQAARD